MKPCPLSVLHAVLGEAAFCEWTAPCYSAQLPRSGIR